MAYRDDIMPPPLCPTCRQPAVIAIPLHGILECAAGHYFDWPRGFDGRGLSGHACPCGSEQFTLRFIRKPRRWWQRLLLAESEVAILRCCSVCRRSRAW